MSKDNLVFVTMLTDRFSQSASRLSESTFD